MSTCRPTSTCVVFWGTMGRKVSRGMKVIHTQTGQQGIVTDVFRGIIHVVLPDGTKASSNASSFHAHGKGGPCLVWIGGAALLLLTGIAAATHAVL